MELENRPILTRRRIRRLPLTAPPPLVNISNPKLAQVSPFARQR